MVCACVFVLTIVAKSVECIYNDTFQYSNMLLLINSNEFYVYYTGNVSLTERMPIAYPHNLFHSKNCFFALDLEWNFVESYVKLQCFVRILSLIILQGSVCTRAR